MSDAIARFGKLRAEHQRRREDWIAKLRSDGVKMARPDDGWVDRENDVIRGPHCYPDFDDGVAVGDLVALGRPESYRLVRVTQIRPWALGFWGGQEWAYEHVSRESERTTR